MEKHFHYWAALTLFSIVSLTAVLDAREDGMDYSREERWMVGVTSVSLCMSAMACFFYMGNKDMFAGKYLELGFIIVVFAMWCAGLPTIMDPEHGFAVASMNQVTNGNLFFASWGAFIMVVTLAVCHFRIFMEGDDKPHLFRWAGFTTASLIVLWTTSAFWNQNCPVDDMNVGMDKACNRSLFGLILSAVSIVFGIGMVGMKVHKAVEQVASIMLFAAWCVAVAFLTYGYGPARAVGTMYFATWFSLLTMLIPAVGAVRDFADSVANTDEPTEDSEVKPLEGVLDDMKGASDKEEEEVNDAA